MATTVQLHEGDRYQEDHGEVTVVTPLGTDTRHNFGPASTRDAIVFTCERPGGESAVPSQKIDAVRAVQEWKEFMAHPTRNIQHVVVLLGDSELQSYDHPGLLAAYQDAGVAVHHIPYASEKSYANIMATLDAIATNGGGAAVAVQCTHGMGRSGRVAAGWLVHRYGLSVERAVEEALSAARWHGAHGVA